MTEEALAAAADDAVQPSQIISDTGADPSAQGRGVHLPEQETPKEDAKPSTRDAIAKAFDEADAKVKAAEKGDEDPDGKKAEGKDADKAKGDKAEEDKAKPDKERGEDGKFAKADKGGKQPEDVKAQEGASEKTAAERSAPDDRQSEGRKHAEPPARFLPEARTKWANVPNEVKAEFHRVSEEFEREIQEHKQFREDLREYEDLAKQHNVTIKDTMARYVEADRALNQDFGRGVAQLIQMYGHNPAQAIASVLQALGTTPQGYAEFVSKNPQAAMPQPAQRTAAPQPQQAAPEVQQLKSEVEQLKTQLQTASVKPVIDRFATDHPDYHTLEPQIAKILSTGVIEQLYGTGLSPEQKLMQAYRMAGGSASPSRSDPEPVPQHSDVEKPVPSDDAGTKSIKGAPTAGQTGEPKWRPKSNREALERAFAGSR